MGVVEQILRTIIDGPLDVDKLDYLYRDSLHCGVPYGLGLDSARLTDSLTTIVVTGSETDTPSACLGIVEKGRISAEVLGFVRHAMFSAVYWHHAYRSIKAMVRFAVGRVVRNLDSSAGSREAFVERFCNTVVLGQAPSGTLFVPRDLGDAGSRPPDEVHLLNWLREGGDTAGKQMVSHIEHRRLFKRALVVSPGRSATRFARLHTVFQHPEETVDAFRVHVEDQLRSALRGHMRDHTVGGPEALAAVEAMGGQAETLCLVDLPLEKHRDADGQRLWYIPETGDRARPLADDSRVWHALAEGLDTAASKFRLLVHPGLHPLIQRYVSRPELEAYVDRAYDHLYETAQVREAARGL
jgi:hypothetical protein